MNLLLVPTENRTSRTLAQLTCGIIDSTIEVLLVAMLLFLPLSLGAVEPWSESTALALGTLISLLLVVRICLRPGEGIPRTAAFIPLLTYVLLVIAQMIALPVSAVRLLSPRTASMKTDLLSDLPDGPARVRHLTLSFYPTATAHDLRIVALTITVFVTVLVVFRSAARIRRLLGAIAVIGGMFAMLALAQDFSGAKGIYWRIPLGELPWYGTFVAHSHFGQHMNLSLGAAIGLLISLPSRARTLRKRDVFMRVGLLLVIAAGTAAVVLSRTRAGTIAVAAGGLLTIVVVILRRGFNRRALIGCVAGAVLIAALLLAGLHRVYSRMATLQQPNEYASRVTTTKDLFGVWRQFPIFGTGLGTHQTFYPRFDSTTMTGLSTHAENDYAQAAEETGLIGLGCAIAFALIVWREWKLAVSTPGPEICLAAAGLGGGFLAVQIQSLSDFGQHIPAVAVLTAVTCGLLINLRRIASQSRTSGALSRRPAVPGRSLAAIAYALAPGMSLSRFARTSFKTAASQRSDPGRVPGRTGLRDFSGKLLGRWKNAGVLGIFALAAFAVWALYTSANAFEAEAYWTQAQDLADGANAAAPESARQAYADLIDTASQAVSADPDDVSHRYWLDVYRWRAVKQLSAAGDPATDPASRAAVSDIVTDLNEARVLCPTYGPLYSVMGQLEYNVLHSPSSGAHLQTAALLAPHDPGCCFLAGSMDANDGKWEAAARKFHLTYEFAPARIEEIVGVYVSHNRPDLVADIDSDDYEWLARVSELLPDQTEEAAKARLRAINLLQGICAGSTAQPAQLARLAALYAAAGQDQAAVDCYQMALARADDRADWHLNRAEALRRLGRFDEARNEAYLALGVQPDLQKARDLIRSLFREPGE